MRPVPHPPTLSRRQALLAGAGVLTLPCAAAWAQTLPALNSKLSGDLYPIHDPCIIKSGDTFYVFCTTPRADFPAQVPWYHSSNLLHWERGGHVLPEIPAWATNEIPQATACWAPDISWFDGQYWLYYACSTFGSNHSAIGLATNKSLDPKSPSFSWTDRGLVLESQSRDDFNALDPNRVIDREGQHWLAFGSFWSGLKMVQIDPHTGMPATRAQRIDLARRPGKPDAIEAVFIIHRAGNYYLFASFDFCCRGASSDYYTVVGRSQDIQGPYIDRSGKPMLEGGGTLVLAAGPSERRWKGPGHIAILRDDDKDFIIYHAYDAGHDGRPTLRIAPLPLDG